MINLKYVILVCALIFLGACSSDDSNGDGNETSLVVGTYALTEVNVSIAQDPNEDGTFSVNMVDELPCLNGILTISADGSWNMALTNLNITTVTGDFYPVFCGDSQDYIGNWSFQNNLLNLNSTFFSTFSFTNAMLVEDINEDLPGILNRKFEKQ